MSSQTMRLLEKRFVPIEVTLMVWSNKMDLLALSNVEGEVILHRLNWQKVWTLQPPSKDITVIGIAWRPDGKVIAVAYSNSDILLINVENREVLHKNHIESEITCIKWIQEKDPSDFKFTPHQKQDITSKYKTQDRTKEFFSNLTLLPQRFESTKKSIKENANDVKKIKDQTHLNILLFGGSSGKLYLNIFGLFSCGIIDMNRHIDDCLCTILDADISEDLNVLFVVLSCWKAVDEMKEEKRELSLILFDTSVLSLYSSEIFTLALKHGNIFNLLQYLSKTMQYITETWENVLLEMDSKLASYAAKVPEGSVSADFLDLLMFGTPSAELEMFLLQDLTEKGLKKLGHSIEMSYDSIQELVLKHLNSAGENLAYHLAELKGISRQRDRYQLLGLKEDRVAKSLLAASAFLVKTTEVQQVIDNSMKIYKVFFRWLYIVIKRLEDEPKEVAEITQQDISFLSEFLYNFDGMSSKQDENSSPSQGSKKTRFNLERLGQYLVDQELIVLSESDSNPWEKFLQENSWLANHPSIIPHFKKMSLVQQQNHLKRAIDDVFSQTEISIGNVFQVCNFLKCLGIPKLIQPKLNIINVVAENKFLLAVLDSSPPPNGFYLMDIPISRNTSTKCVYFHFNLPMLQKNEIERDNKSPCSCTKILDLQFYSQNILSVLFEQSGENREATLVQFDLVAAMKTAMSISFPFILTKDTLSSIPEVDGSKLLENGIMRSIDNMIACKFAVSGARKVAVILSESHRIVKVYEMEVEEYEEEEEENEEVDVTARNFKDYDVETEEESSHFQKN